MKTILKTLPTATTWAACRWIWPLLFGATTIFGQDGRSGRPEKILYENNFESAALENVPDNMLVLDGAFAVKQETGNRVLELPGAPLDTFGTLFGPSEASGLSVSARVHGKAKGRLFPTFAVGLGGVGGYRLQVSPGKRLLELSKGEEVLTSIPYSWESGSWTVLRLQLRKIKDQEWKIEGKAWKQDSPEPTAWPLVREVKSEPSPGRPSLWGSPYAGTPIQFDDLVVRQVN